MEIEDIKAIFDQFEDSFLKFDSVKIKRSFRPDLHAFLLLESLTPDNHKDIVASAGHDQIWLGVELDELAESLITEQDIKELVACGVLLMKKQTVCACSHRGMK